MTNNFAAEEFAIHGAVLLKGAILPHIEELKSAIVALPEDQAGVRLHGLRALGPLLAGDGAIGAIADKALGKSTRPVRAILFNKSADTNWALAWHQDRTICVKERREAPGFGPWTIKSGMNHVSPPFDLLARMVTLRAHIDDVPANNAPLLIAPGSHTYGRVAINHIQELVNRCGTATCLAEAGDVWLYATPILHASEVASAPKSRRVLQVDFAAEELPHGLEWLGV